MNKLSNHDQFYYAFKHYPSGRFETQKNTIEQVQISDKQNNHNNFVQQKPEQRKSSEKNQLQLRDLNSNQISRIIDKRSYQSINKELRQYSQASEQDYKLLLQDLNEKDLVYKRKARSQQLMNEQIYDNNNELNKWDQFDLNNTQQVKQIKFNQKVELFKKGKLKVSQKQQSGVIIKSKYVWNSAKQKRFMKKNKVQGTLLSLRKVQTKLIKHSFLKIKLEAFKNQTIYYNHQIGNKWQHNYFNENVNQFKGQRYQSYA